MVACRHFGPAGVQVFVPREVGLARTLEELVECLLKVHQDLNPVVAVLSSGSRWTEEGILLLVPQDWVDEGFQDADQELPLPPRRPPQVLELHGDPDDDVEVAQDCGHDYTSELQHVLVHHNLVKELPHQSHPCVESHHSRACCAIAKSKLREVRAWASAAVDVSSSRRAVPPTTIAPSPLLRLAVCRSISQGVTFELVRGVKINRKLHVIWEEIYDVSEEVARSIPIGCVKQLLPARLVLLAGPLIEQAVHIPLRELVAEYLPRLADDLVERDSRGIYP
eukprot:2923674-Pyramimonas_sp.AAC.1